jgi:hypothetical protein
MRKRTAQQSQQILQKADDFAISFLTELSTVAEKAGGSMAALQEEIAQEPLLTAQEQQALHFLEEIDEKFMDLIMTISEHVGLLKDT